MINSFLKSLKNPQTITLLILCLIFFVVPFLIQGTDYIVGGDDMKLYYIFPEMYLKNYSFNIASDNTLAGALTGYSSVSYFAPFFAVIYILKFIPVNTQAFMYGLNFAFGFFFFYKFLGLYIDIKNTWNVFLAKVLASVFYIFSPFLNETLYSHQLMHLYLVAILPTTLFLFIKGIRGKDLRYVLGSVLLFSIVSTTYNSLPFTASFAIPLFPILIYEFWNNKKTFLVFSLIAVSVFVGLNFYWIFHIVYGVFHNTGLTNNIALFSTGDSNTDNIRIVMGVSRLFSPLNQIFQTMISGVYIFHSLTQAIGILFILVILIAGSLLSIEGNNKTSTRYSLFLFSLLLSWFLFSPNFGNWGPNLFLFFTKTVPLFGMFRNMYDKFAPALAFFYAVSFGISLATLVTSIKNKKLVNILFICLAVVLLIHTPRLLSPFANDRESLTRITGQFNDDYMNLLKYIKTIPDASRVAWIPLNAATYANIEDKNGNFYSGLSPFRVLANRSDYTGRFSFLTQKDVFLGDKVFLWLKNGEYEKVGETLQKVNARYIIVDHQTLPQSMQSFMFGGEDKLLLTYQGEEFQKEILGEKIRDFGLRYSLYYINGKYANDTLFLSDEISSFPDTFNNLDYRKITSSHYKGTVTNLSSDKKLVFLDPFNSDWKLYLIKDGKRELYQNGKNTVAFDYANAWDINYEELKTYYGNFITYTSDSTFMFDWELYFEPQKYTIYLYSISISVFLIVISYIFWPRKADKLP